MTPFVQAMQTALARILAAATPLERMEAEGHMAQLIRAQYHAARIPMREGFDVKKRQAADPDDPASPGMNF